MPRLENINNIRVRVCENLTSREKINYCAKIIFDTHNFLSNSGNKLPRYAKNKAMEILVTAENELRK